MTNPDGAGRASSEALVDRPLYVAVVEEDCTGCNTCVDYCLVDCIEPAPPDSDHRMARPIRVREDECIGCFVCAKVCEELAVNAIRLVPTDAARSGTGVPIDGRAARP
jgi:Pyruvate/2-oxoacid:ferredoxin oxidoreductase delta subunit